MASVSAEGKPGGEPAGVSPHGSLEADEPALATENYPLATLGLMLASVMQVLDTTIANVALPHMQSSLSASTDSVTWVLTSYMIASAVATPVTGWLADRVGARRLFIVGLFFFIVASMLCGAARNLEQIVIFRVIQGIAGAFLPPLSQSFMLDTTRPSRHPTVMSIWSATVMVGPIVGPLLGGWLTENWNWRFVFYINLPVGLIALVILLTQLPERPTIRRRFDMFGFIWLSLALAGMQLFLDRGNHVDWFDSTEVWVYAMLVACGGWISLVHFRTSPHPLLNFGLFRDRNFALATGFMVVLGGILFSTLALIPPMMQNLFGYTVMGTGLVLMPRGLGSIVSTLIGGVLTRRGVDLRLTMGAGMVVTALTMRAMAGWPLEVDSTTIVVTAFVQGMGFGLVFIPINILAFSTLAPNQRTEASSIMNLCRGVGGSVGISVVIVALARNMQISHADIAGNITRESGGAVLDVSSMDRFQQLGDAAMTIVNAEVTRQAAMVAYVDDFYLMSWATLLMVPLLLLLRTSKPAS